MSPDEKDLGRTGGTRRGGPEDDAGGGGDWRRGHARDCTLRRPPLTGRPATTTIYGSHMKQKTTVYLDADAYQRLKRIARARRRPPAELVREAVLEYAAKHEPARAAKSVGAFRSGRRDLSERAEALLDGLGRER